MNGDRLLVVRLAERRKELERKREEIENELELIDEMLSTEKAQSMLEELERNGFPSRLEVPEGVKPETFDENEVLSEIRLMDLSKLTVWEAAKTVLEHIDHALPRDLLCEAILVAGRDFGGNNPSNALAAHVSQHPDELMARDGWIYLTEWLEPRTL